MKTPTQQPHTDESTSATRLPCSDQRSVRGGRGRSVRFYFTQDTMLKTDLQSALHQIEGHHSRVRDATAHNATKSTKEQVLLGAKLTTVPL